MSDFDVDEGTGTLNAEGSSSFDPDNDSTSADSTEPAETDTDEGIDTLAGDENTESLNGDESDTGKTKQRDQRKSESVPYDRFQSEVAERQKLAERVAQLSPIEERLMREPALQPYLNAGLTLDKAVERFEQESAQYQAQQAAEAQTTGTINQWQEDGLIDPSVAGPLLSYIQGLTAEVSKVRPMAQSFEQQQREANVRAEADRIMVAYPKAEREDVEFRLRTTGDAQGAEATAARQHAKYTVSRDEIIADHTAKTAKRAGQVVPAAKGGSDVAPRQSPIPDPIRDPEAFGKYLEKSKNKAWSNRYG